MSSLADRDREFVALGAAIASNCVPCTEYHVSKARETGLTDTQIGEAVRIADTVRRVPARLVLSRARELLGKRPEEPADVSNTDCGCSAAAS